MNNQINSIIGNHLSDKQIRRFIDQLKSEGFLKMEGTKGHFVYVIGDSFKANNNILQKALNIGMAELKKNGEI